MSAAGLFAQLSSTSPSPFDPTQDAAGHAVFEGACIDIVNGFEIQFNDSPWFQIPTTAPSNGAGETPVSGTYDLNCADETYKFWIYHSQADTWLFNAGLSGMEVDTISIRGVTSLGYTQSTVYVQPPQPPTDLKIRATGPKLGVGQNQCMEFNISLHQGDGSYESYDGGNISFSLEKQVNGGSASTSYNLFNSWADCQNSSNATLASSLIIPQYQQEIRVYYRATEAIGSTLTFNLSYAQTPIPLVLGSGESRQVKNPSTDVYIDFQVPHSVIPDACYPVEIMSRTYNHNLDSTRGDTIAFINLPPEVRFYPDGSCSTGGGTISGTTLSSGIATVYMKVTGTSIPADTYFGAVETSSALDDDSRLIWYDMTGSNSISQMMIHSSERAFAGNPEKMEIVVFNENGTPVPLASSMSVNLAASGSGAYFCSMFTSCTSNELSSGVSIPTGTYRYSLRFKPLSTGLLNITATSGGITVNTNINVEP